MTSLFRGIDSNFGHSLIYVAYWTSRIMVYSTIYQMIMVEMVRLLHHAYIYIHRGLTLIDYARSTPLGQYVRLITLVSHLWVNTFDWLRSFLTFESICSIDYARFTPLGQYVLIDYTRFTPLSQYIRLITLVSHIWVNTFWLITLVSHLWVNTFDWLR
jgi:hypothetical protein